MTKKYSSKRGKMNFHAQELLNDVEDRNNSFLLPTPKGQQSKEKMERNKSVIIDEREHEQPMRVGAKQAPFEGKHGNRITSPALSRDVAEIAVGVIRTSALRVDTICSPHGLVSDVVPRLDSMIAVARRFFGHNPHLGVSTATYVLAYVWKRMGVHASSTQHLIVQRAKELFNSYYFWYELMSIFGPAVAPAGKMKLYAPEYREVRVFQMRRMPDTAVSAAQEAYELNIHWNKLDVFSSSGRLTAPGQKDRDAFINPTVIGSEILTNGEMVYDMHMPGRPPVYAGFGAAKDIKLLDLPVKVKRHVRLARKETRIDTTAKRDKLEFDVLVKQIGKKMDTMSLSKPAQSNLRTKSQLNGANGETKGKDFVSKRIDWDINRYCERVRPDDNYFTPLGSSFAKGVGSSWSDELCELWAPGAFARSKAPPTVDTFTAFLAPNNNVVKTPQSTKRWPQSRKLVARAHRRREFFRERRLSAIKFDGLHTIKRSKLRYPMGFWQEMNNCSRKLRDRARQAAIPDQRYYVSDFGRGPRWQLIPDDEEDIFNLREFNYDERTLVVAVYRGDYSCYADWKNSRSPIVAPPLVEEIVGRYLVNRKTRDNITNIYFAGEGRDSHETWYEDAERPFSAVDKEWFREFYEKQTFLARAVTFVKRELRNVAENVLSCVLCDDDLAKDTETCMQTFGDDCFADRETFSQEYEYGRIYHKNLDGTFIASDPEEYVQYRNIVPHTRPPDILFRERSFTPTLMPIMEELPPDIHVKKLITALLPSVGFDDSDEFFLTQTITQAYDEKLPDYDSDEWGGEGKGDKGDYGGAARRGAPKDDEKVAKGRDAGKGKGGNGNNGNKMINGKVINSDTGGKSKNHKECEAKEEGKADAKAMTEKLEGIKTNAKNRRDSIARKFMCSARPKCRFALANDTPTTSKMDMEGAPFCGLVCIDTVADHKIDVESYLSLLDDADIDKIGLTVGTPTYLSQYAAKRGLNLAIYSQTLDGPCEAIYRLNRNPFWPWAVLWFDCLPGQELGHYQVFFEPRAALPLLQFACTNREVEVQPLVAIGEILRREAGLFANPQFDADTVRASIDLKKLAVAFSVFDIMNPFGWIEIVRMFVDMVVSYLIRFKIHITFTRTDFRAARAFEPPHLYEEEKKEHERAGTPKRYSDEDGRDRREFRNQRESVVTEATYVHVTVELVYEPGTTKFPAFIHDLFDGYVTLLDNLVSEQHMCQVWPEIQYCVAQGLTTAACYAGMSRMRGINVDSQRNDIYLSTIRLLKYMEMTLVRGLAVHDTVGLVAVSVDSRLACQPDLKVVMKSQIAGMGRERGFKDAPITNYIKDGFRNLGNDPKTGHCLLNGPYEPKPVAIATLGVPIFIDGVPLGYGMVPTNGPWSIMMGWANRAMSKDPTTRVQKTIDEYLAFCKWFLQPFIDSCEVEYGQPDLAEHFSTFYKKKRSAAFIRKHVQELDQFEKGMMNRKQLELYHRNGAFVKFENSTKITHGVARVKPRNIMTMSNYMLIHLCPITKVLDAWNHSSWSQFQTKGMSNSEMCAVIMEATDRDHSVTDYSNFESSLDYVLRSVENDVFVQLMRKAGYTTVIDDYLKHHGDTRELHTQWGTLVMNTRGSGDFITSAGNGVGNVCFNAFCWYMKYGTMDGFSMIAEGDDGITATGTADPTLLSELGVSFSSNVRGTQNGDTDFLRSRWISGKRYINIGRALKVFYVAKGSGLKRSKQLFLLRAAASSLYWMSPGHPVLSAIVNRIGRQTSGVSVFKGWESYFDAWTLENKKFSAFPPHVEVDESMRGYISEGALGFPPISIAEQLTLERIIENDDVMYFGRMLTDYDDVVSFNSTSPGSTLSGSDQEAFREVLKILDDAEAHYSSGKSYQDYLDACID